MVEAIKLHYKEGGGHILQRLPLSCTLTEHVLKPGFNAYKQGLGVKSIELLALFKCHVPANLREMIAYEAGLGFKSLPARLKCHIPAHSHKISDIHGYPLNAHDRKGSFALC